MSNIPGDLFYTTEHEYVKFSPDGLAQIGITDYAQGELGDVVFVELPKIGASFATHDVFGTVEAVKAVSELFCPVAGEVVAIDTGLDKEPALVNTDPYGNGLDAPNQACRTRCARRTYHARSLRCTHWLLAPRFPAAGPPDLPGSARASYQNALMWPRYWPAWVAGRCWYLLPCPAPTIWRWITPSWVAPRRPATPFFGCIAGTRPRSPSGVISRHRASMTHRPSRAAGIGIVRRPTGGRAVLHDREVTYSVTARLPEGTAARIRARDLYRAINALLVDALRELGVRAALAPAHSVPTPIDDGGSTEWRPQGIPRPSEYPCFDVATEGEVIVAGRKLVGSAQWRDADAVLQHGSILIADDQGRLGTISRAPIVPAPVATLSQLLGRAPTIEEVARVLRAALDETLRQASCESAHDYYEDAATDARVLSAPRAVCRRRLDLAALKTAARLPGRVAGRHVGAAVVPTVRFPRR